jgi:hypothetical protein
VLFQPVFMMLAAKDRMRHHLAEVVQPISPQPLDSQEYRPISDLYV